MNPVMSAADLARPVVTLVSCAMDEEVRPFLDALPEREGADPIALLGRAKAWRLQLPGEEDRELVLVRSGIHLVKFWFSVSQKEQRRRFRERAAHPLKQWKLSPIDKASLDKWDDYPRAKEAMFFETDTADSPWTVIKSDCKKRARLNAMRYILHKLPYSNKSIERIGKLDPLIVGRAHVVYERGERPDALL